LVWGFIPHYRIGGSSSIKGGTGMAYVKFTKIGSRIGVPKASIWTRGQIGFNQGAVAEYKLESYTHAVLYYDEEAKKVGFELTDDPKAEGAIKLIVRKNAGISMSARSFLKTFKIDFSETRQYNLSYDKVANLYEIDLNEPV
jgi:hypothetical protein